jgi:cell division protein FtsI (penicillin-binding protein 3)
MDSARRVRWLVRIAMVWAAILLGRLVQVQILEHDEYSRKAAKQQTRLVEVPAPRGGIYDRHGRSLALSIPVDSVCLNPMRLPEVERGGTRWPDVQLVADLLCPVLKLDKQEFIEQLESYVRQRRGFMWVARRVTPEQAATLRGMKTSWLEFRTESMRSYPNGTLAAHLLGGVDHEERGNSGVEMGLDLELEGRPGTLRVIADSRQRGFDSEVETPPQPGSDVLLTIDRRIQHVAERALEKAIKENNLEIGSVVVMDPRTGEIYAMASYPTFDPNEPVRNLADQKARLNQAISAPFEPGSVFKVITMAAALETTNLNTETMIDCGRGSINLFGRTIRDHVAHGTIPMREVLAQSSNIGAIKVGLRVGDAKMHEYIRRFGFGEPTGIQLPAEAGGRVFRLERWQKSSIGSVAMGHELMTTTVQLAQSVTAVANGGLLVRPKIVLESRRPGVPLRNASWSPEVEAPRRILRPETANTLRQMMEQVVLSPHGTGKRAKLEGYSSAGKTGSAQIYDPEKRVYTHRYNASFMGFAPVTNPAVVVVVTMSPSAKFGGAISAPVFQEITTAALRLLDVPKDLPDRPAETPKPEAVPEMNDVSIAELGAPPELEAPPAEAEIVNAMLIGPKVPDLRGKTMRDVMAECAALGIPVSTAGNGIARIQNPAPGQPLPAGERIKVRFSP